MKISPVPSPTGRHATLRDALRRKFKTPREALRALGLDEKLLDVPRLAYDGARKGRDEMPDEAALNNEPDPAVLRVKLEKLLCENLDGAALQTARDLLSHHLGELTGEYDRAASDEDDDEDDGEESEEALRERRKKIMGRVADWLSERQQMSDEMIERELADFPRNGLEHVGGALDDDLAQVMEQRRRRMASDTKKRQQAFDEMFPEARRLTGTLLETSYGVQPERPPCANFAGFYEMFPQARRIGVA